MALTLTDAGPGDILAATLAESATQALLDEVRLSPKPGLVDSRGSGSHRDLTLALMEHSAHSLTATFNALAQHCWRRSADIALRQEVGRLGREGEREMMAATGGVNTHRGAIWAVGLLVSAVAMQPSDNGVEHIARRAAELARLPDEFSPKTFSKGACAVQRYRLPGAKEEAQSGFPHVTGLALPELQRSREAGASESQAQLNALLAVMTSLADTCVLSRGGMPALLAMQRGAASVLHAGGVQTAAGVRRLMHLERQMLADNVSPGGAADLLAATLFVDRIGAKTHPIHGLTS
ncbi:triphosphoribosyl-dephospho-CoA synthase MdcB [Rouxiella silvae]|uniref:2-(5''-triphosphoribosyl)-3'-dephosphocoenzyme-A synthase n=1 Tax=Rouxiella silvae TaxID=1646373 RepID=A0AA41BXW3_9GAMM|nr:triphosphoribosyl-dephospho-CoA synthase [Rouxiella silvae]KQN48304.1 triphosphoribosyl-dephospho-CoA synthase MdcB [Serratia sp. Leaf50]MBF6638369.1 triphosphoribosyl-dephospho-CoA synthase [Rouxiella silvae]ORJ21891.1 triphosphoribosyl-dephospho-CoA synthase MdcB [Rouxiella silvae]